MGEGIFFALQVHGPITGGGGGGGQGLVNRETYGGNLQ